MNPIEAILALSEALGVKAISDPPRIWEERVDAQWYVAVNGYKTTMIIQPPGMMEAEVPGYHFCVWYNGWVAGVLSPYGGGFADGEGANVKAFAEAIQKRIKEIQDGKTR